MVVLDKKSKESEWIIRENEHLKQAIIQMKSSTGFSQYQGYNPVTPTND